VDLFRGDRAPQIIGAETSQRAHDMLAARGRGPCQHKPHDRRRAYAFAGSMFCGVCDCGMQGHWLNEAPYYRCRFPARVRPRQQDPHPRNVYLREDASEADVNGSQTTMFAPHRLRGPSTK
jgi:site-specific DNA recombinase